MSLEELEQALRDAVAANEFSRAAARWTEYAGELERQVRERRAGAREMAGAWQLVEWVRQASLAARGRAQADLALLELRQRYGPPARVASPLVRIAG